MFAFVGLAYTILRADGASEQAASAAVSAATAIISYIGMRALEGLLRVIEQKEPIELARRQASLISDLSSAKAK